VLLAAATVIIKTRHQVESHGIQQFVQVSLAQWTVPAFPHRCQEIRPLFPKAAPIVFELYATRTLDLPLHGGLTEPQGRARMSGNVSALYRPSLSVFA